MFAQHININGINMANSQEFMKICSEHPECIGCPLRDKDVQLKGRLTRCDTGRAKGHRK